MITVKNIAVSGLAQAIHGMRNPLESWDKSDSKVRYVRVVENATAVLMPITASLPDYASFADPITPVVSFHMGSNDKKLALKLIKAGTDHSKFMRQIRFIADITAPMTWWWDFDTYKVSTTKNSTSRMHKLGGRVLTPEDLGWDDVDDFREKWLTHLNTRITAWQIMRNNPNQDPEHVRAYWRRIIDDLPESYMFTATWDGSYQTLRAVYASRRNHKQVEFDAFREVLRSLPCSYLITEGIEG